MTIPVPEFSEKQLERFAPFIHRKRPILSFFGVDLAPPGKGEAKEKTRKSAERAYARGHGAPPKSTPSAKRSRAIHRALEREGHEAASPRALAKQAHSAAQKRSPSERSAAAKKAARTKGPAERSAAARKAARTRAARS